MGENEFEPLDADDIGTREKAERYVKRVGEDNAQAPAQFAKELMAGKRSVFFYAGSDLDLQPLHRFTHVADTFILVDPRKTEAEFEAARQQLVNRQTRAGTGLVAVTKGLHPEAAYGAVTEVTGELAVMRNEPWARIPNIQDRPAWGAVQRLERRVGGTSREIWLVFVAGSPVIAYERLLVGTGTAPVCLALCVPQFVHHDPGEGLIEAGLNPQGHPPIEQQWADFAGWNGELGQLIRAHNAPLPKFLVADAVMDWPTHEIRYTIPSWRNRFTIVFTMENNPWPALTPARGGGSRRLVIKRQAINPHVAREFGAVVMGNERYRQYRWPAGVLAILNGPPVNPEHAVPNGPAVVNLNIGGTPLLQALASVEAACAERGISTVAIEGLPGFEDEADDLALWCRQEGQIRKLVLYLHCDGHYLDYGQVADEID